MLYDSEVDFEEEVIDAVEIFGGGKWPEVKFESGAGRFHSVPTLEHKGRMLNETNAIAYYIAEQCGYMPTDPMDRAEVLMIADHIYEDVIVNVAYAIWDKRDWDKDVMGAFGSPDAGLPLKYRNLEGILSKSASGFAVGSQISLADYYIYYAVDMMYSHVKPATDGEKAFQLIMGDKTNLLKHYAMMNTRPKIVAYNASEKGKACRANFTAKAAFGEGTVAAGMGDSELTQWGTLSSKIVALLEKK
jgi:glutathione S-transferase